MPRDDFSQATKLAMAQRVGYYCSYPGCGKLTIGPSEESERATSAHGTACHISAASAGIGSRRYNPNITPEERAAIENGIWMCNDHGKIIDTDEKRYTIEMLKFWRLLAEATANMMNVGGYDFKTASKLANIKRLGPIEESLTNASDVFEVIGDAINDSCLPIIWDEELSHIIRDYTIEHYLNAFEHGKAENFTLVINENKVVLKDDGLAFQPEMLLNYSGKTGGSLSLKSLVTDFNDKIIFISRREQNENIVIVASLKDVNDIFSLTPCAITFRSPHGRISEVVLPATKDCDKFYVVLPKYLAPSRAIGFSIIDEDDYNENDFENVSRLKYANNKLVFLANRFISNSVLEIIRERFQGCQMIVI